MRWLMAALCAFKLAVRLRGRSSSVIDLGDAVLLALLFLIKPHGGDPAFDEALMLPRPAQALEAILCLAGLFLFGRALSGLLGMDEPENLIRVRPGGAALALIRLRSHEALPAAALFCIPGAALEEILFRWLLHGALTKAVGGPPAILLQAAAFAAMHALPAHLLRHSIRVRVYAWIFPFISAVVLAHMINAGWGLVAPISVHSLLNTLAAWRWKFRYKEGII